MSWITSSEGGGLFPKGDAPPLHGTLLTFSDGRSCCTPRATSELSSTYPGMYVPQPIGIRPARPHPQRPRYRKRDPRAHQDELEPDTPRRPPSRSHCALPARSRRSCDSAPLTRPSRLGVSTGTVKTWRQRGLITGHPFNDKGECPGSRHPAPRAPARTQGRKLSKRATLLAAPLPQTTVDPPGTCPTPPLPSHQRQQQNHSHRP